MSRQIKTEIKNAAGIRVVQDTNTFLSDLIWNGVK
jgi:hypothetical protein